MARNRYQAPGGAVRVLGAPARATGALWRWLRPGLAPMLVVASLAGLGFAGWRAVIDSPYFTVRVVEVDATLHLPRERIVELLGLDRPTSIFRFDETSATEVLLQERWVATARVVRTLPDKVSVEIEERRPAGVVVIGELFLVDDDGHPFVKPGRGEAAGLPLVTGLSRAQWSADRDASAARVRAALALARSYQRLPLSTLRPLSDVHIGAGGRMELMLGRTRVTMGRHDFEEKLVRLVEIDRSLRKRNMDASYVLLSDDLKRAIVMEKPLDTQASTMAPASAKGVD